MTTTVSITPRTSLAELAASHAGASRVFHRHGLDFCCHGQRSLAEACEPKGLDADALVAELELEIGSDQAGFERWNEQPLDVLIPHLLERFHAGHREELPRLLAMARKVEAVHGDKAGCPRGLAAHLEHVSEALEEHMQKEEQVLFPMILGGGGRMAAMPVRVMEQEHEDHGRNLARIRELAHDFVPPAEACNTWRALYLGLAGFEREIMEHIHLENNVLFPRALQG